MKQELINYSNDHIETPLLLNTVQKRLLFCIFSIFLIMQSINLGHRWVDDESWYTIPIPTIIEEGTFRTPGIPGGDEFWPVPPITTYSQALLETISPITSASSRLIPLVTGIFSLWALFLLGRRYFHNNIAILAVFFMAADNLFFLAARTVRPEIFVTLFFILTLYFFDKSYDQKVGVKNLFLAGLMSALAISSHPNGLLAPLSIGLLLLFKYGFKQKFFTRSFTYGASLLLFILPFITWMYLFDKPYDFVNFKYTWLGGYGRYTEEVNSTSMQIVNFVVHEIEGRYTDFIKFPFRVHIAIVSILLLCISIFSKKQTIKVLAYICIAQLLFFIFVNNSSKSARYITTLVPFVSLLAAAWCYTLLQSFSFTGKKLISVAAFKDYRIIITAFILLSLGFSQTMGNGYFLWKARSADYQKLTSEINEIIPKNSTVYGSLTFWLGLREHEFVPYMRMPWKIAVNVYRPNIVIMDDWVMTGSGVGSNWSILRKELQLYLKAHGELIGRVDNEYYGDLKIYRVNY